MKNETEYIVYIINLKYKDSNKSVFDMYSFKTEKYVEKKEENKDVVVKEKSNDDIFYQPGIEKYLLKECIDVEDGIVYVSQESSLKDVVRHYKPESEYIEDINTPIYNLLTSRLQDNERGNFTRAVYVTDETKYSCVYISITESHISRYPLYGFILEEKNMIKDVNPYEAPIRMIVNRIGDSNSENALADEYYINRLEKDLKVLYGEVGSKICEFIVDEYNYRYKILKEYMEGKRDKDSLPFIHNKKFENTKIYSKLSVTNDLYFYFEEENEGDNE